MACSLFALRGGTRVKRRRCAFVRSLVRLNARRVDACLGTKGLASSRNTFHRQVNTRDTTSRHPRFSANCIIWRNISHEQSHILPVEFARLAVYSLLRISFIEPLCQTMLFLFPLKTYPSNFPGKFLLLFRLVENPSEIESSMIVVWIGRERNRFFALVRTNLREQLGGYCAYFARVAFDLSAILIFIRYIFSRVIECCLKIECLSIVVPIVPT